MRNYGRAINYTKISNFEPDLTSEFSIIDPFPIFTLLEIIEELCLRLINLNPKCLYLIKSFWVPVKCKISYSVNKQIFL